MADRLLRETKPGPGYLPEIIPGQYWDQDADGGQGGYERVQGSGGAPRVLLWGPDGSALLTAEKPGYVDVADRADRVLGAVSVATSTLPSGAATEAKQDTLIAKDFATQTTLEAARVLLDTISGKDFATQATLAAVLAKLIAAPATEAKQDALIAKDFATEAKLEAVRALLAGTINTQLSGSNAEVVSAQDAQVSTIAQTYIRAVDATQIEVYVESGYVRVRTDGEAATPTTGEPFGPGYGGAWTVNSISVYYVADSTITVVSR